MARPGGVRPAPLVVGMVLFIASETMFFGALFGTYYTLRAETPVWPPRGVDLNSSVAEMAVATAILAASSIPAHLAAHAIRDGSQVSAVRRLLVTSVMGLIFLGLKVHDWLTAGFSISSHAYGTIFFTLTGFHALHMSAGIILLLGLAAKVAGGRYAIETPRGAPRPPGARQPPLPRFPQSGGPDAVVYYWHFVDAVWLTVFGTIWLIR
ncbi:MAG TPA: cytochrome c oxidase subunit 3 [bacterium]|nr:cytochrome c oxidase subunit 3 [bacterium]